MAKKVFDFEKWFDETGIEDTLLISILFDDDGLMQESIPDEFRGEKKLFLVKTDIGESGYGRTLEEACKNWFISECIG